MCWVNSKFHSYFWRTGNNLRCSEVFHLSPIKVLLLCLLPMWFIFVCLACNHILLLKNLRRSSQFGIQFVAHVGYDILFWPNDARSLYTSSHKTVRFLFVLFSMCVRLIQQLLKWIQTTQVANTISVYWDGIT